MSVGQLPESKAPKTKPIVLMAFHKGEDGELVQAFEPREMPDERRAIQQAKELASLHAGVITWSRDARPDVGEFGEPTVLYSHGDLPDLGMPTPHDDRRRDRPLRGPPQPSIDLPPSPQPLRKGSWASQCSLEPVEAAVVAKRFGAGVSTISATH